MIERTQTDYSRPMARGRVWSSRAGDRNRPRKRKRQRTTKICDAEQRCAKRTGVAQIGRIDGSRTIDRITSHSIHRCDGLRRAIHRQRDRTRPRTGASRERAGVEGEGRWWERSREDIATGKGAVAQAGMLGLHADEYALEVDRREELEVRTGAFAVMEFERGEAVSGSWCLRNRTHVNSEDGR